MSIYDSVMCDFQRTGNNRYTCKYCNTMISYFEQDIPTLVCKAKLQVNNIKDMGISINPYVSDKTQPDNMVVDKIIEFNKQAAMDNPEACTEEQIAARYAICTSCEFFNKNVCTKCGCNLAREQVYMNKLAWKEHSCPVGKWKSIS